MNNFNVYKIYIPRFEHLHNKKLMAVFSNLLNYWTETVRLSAEICDYHLKNIMIEGDDNNLMRIT